MIVADANVFLRHLGPPKTDQDRAFAELANALFTRAMFEPNVFTSTDAVIAEVAFILSSTRHYNVSRQDVYRLLTPLLALPGCSIPNKADLVLALQYWMLYPTISFVDSICLVLAQSLSIDLMSFDRRLLRILEISRINNSPETSEKGHT